MASSFVTRPQHYLAILMKVLDRMLKKIISKNPRLLGSGVAGFCILAGVLAAIQGMSHAHGGNESSNGSSGSTPPGTVCGQSILRSPYSYHGEAGSYQSGTAGLPTFGKPGTAFPNATHGVVLPTGKNVLASYEVHPNTVYYLLPGTHTGGIQADANDVFVGGYWNGQQSILSGNYDNGGQAIDSNPTIGDQPNVVIEYLTIEKYQPNVDAGTINQEANIGWLIRYNTITLNVPGAGVILGAGNKLIGNCLTQNGQYGFQAADTDGFGKDSLTGGPYGIVVSQNEISYNDTCDLSGLINNKAIGWKNHNPVPAEYRNPKCGTVVGDGNQGGFKLWQTNGVTVSQNDIHDNWGPGAWVDTDNANTTFSDNSFTHNEGEAIVEEISYNFSITGNYMANNDWIDGLENPAFPQAAIYISESGSDTIFGGVPACQESLCATQPSYPHQSIISGNTLVNNGGGIFLWQSSNRYCSDGSDGVCTLVDGGAKGPFTVANCKANLPTAAVNTSTYVAEKTGTPLEDWWDGCLWQTSNVLITENIINFNPIQISYCNSVAWPDCGANGIFSQYGSPPNKEPGWVIPTELTFFQNNTWSKNTYHGPSSFFAWNQGNGNNPISWREWTSKTAEGDMCESSGDRSGGYCLGSFGQDTGSTYSIKTVS